MWEHCDVCACVRACVRVCVCLVAREELTGEASLLNVEMSCSVERVMRSSKPWRYS